MPDEDKTFSDSLVLAFGFGNLITSGAHTL